VVVRDIKPGDTLERFADGAIAAGEHLALGDDVDDGGSLRQALLAERCADDLCVEEIYER
jgi:hypothetical protein